MKRIHKVCTMVKRWESFHRGTKNEECKECPMHETVDGDRCIRGCVLIAREFINIVTVGNPWGVKGKEWPKKKKPKAQLTVIRGGKNDNG